jgi:hypothetical protein
MDKPFETKLIETLLKMQKEINDISIKLDSLEMMLSDSNEILIWLETLFSPPKPIDNEEVVTFTKELYNEISKHCGKDGLRFMAIA